jgi:hypothetical protein
VRTAPSSDGTFQINFLGITDTDVQIFVTPDSGNIVGLTFRARSLTPVGSDLNLTPVVGGVDKTTASATLNSVSEVRALTYNTPIPFSVGQPISLKWQHTGTATVQVYLQLEF